MASPSEQFIADYLMSLKDLTFNSGPIIHSLTVIAKENRDEHSPAVVEAIRRHLKSCAVKARLPVMYLIDSIIKNVGGVYREQFAPKIYEIFTECYQSVPQDVQQKLARLSTFWADKFDASITQALSDFIRRQSLKRKAVPSTNGSSGTSHPMVRPTVVGPTVPVFSPGQLNLMHSVQRLLMQRQQASLMMPGDISLLGQIQTLQQILRRLQGPLPDAQIEQIAHQIALWSGPMAAFGAVPPPMHGYPAGIVGTPGLPMAAAVPPALGPHPALGRSSPASRLKLSDITLGSDLNVNYPGSVDVLYDNLPLQCKQCGFRFRDDADGRAKNTAHLDWHFRQNRKMKDLMGKTHSRDWFLKDVNWLEQKSIDTTSSQTPVFFDVAADKDKETVPSDSTKDALPAIVVTATLPLDDENQECAVCHEKFETFWDEEEEEWMMKDAIKMKEKVYHTLCAKDLPDSPVSPVRKRSKKDSQEYDIDTDYAFDV